MKVYITGKIGGLSELEYTEKFNNAKIEVKNLGHEPISPVDFKHEHDKRWQSYMKEDLTEMMKCDAVYALNNWRHSPGATIEINLATQLGLQILHQK